MTTGGGGTTTMGEILLRVIGGGGPSDAPGGAVDPNNMDQGSDSRAEKAKGIKERDKQTSALEGIEKKTGGYVRNTLGINIGVAAILKQSQIFTGTLGTIFQILGALVDVILAPFMPLIVKGIQMIADNIPGIQAKAQQIVGGIVKLIEWIGRVVSTVRNWLPEAVGNKIKAAFQYVIIGLFLTKLLGAWGLMTGIIKVTSAITHKLLTRLVYGQQAAMARGGGGPMGPVHGPFAPRGTMKGQGIGGPRAAGLIGGASMVALGAATGSTTTGVIGGASMGASLGMAGGPMGMAVGAVIGGVAGGIIAAQMGKKEDEIQASKSNPDQYNPNREFVGTGSSGRLALLSEVEE